MSRLAVLAGCIAVLIGFSGWAEQYSNVAGIFQVPTGARPLGIGGGFLALADDENAAFYNPAALGWIKKLGVTSILARPFDVVSYGAVSLAAPSFGATYLHLDSGAIETQDVSVRYLSQGAVVSLGVSAGAVGLGVRGKVYRVTEPYRAQGWAIDPAFLVVTEVIRAGFLYENAYSQGVTFDGGHQEDWEKRLRMGAAIRLPFSEDVLWQGVFEGSGLFSGDPLLAGGIEAWVGGLAARIGYDGWGATFGMSVMFSSFQIDWAYAARLEIVRGHSLSFTFRF